MESFTTTIKHQLVRIPISSSCCQRALLSAMIHMNGRVHLSEKRLALRVATESPSLARYLFTLSKEIYQVVPMIFVQKRKRFYKKHRYELRWLEKVLVILEDLCIIDSSQRVPWQRIVGVADSLVAQICCRRAYLCGVFLAGGSIADPHCSSYHLEIVTSDHGYGQALQNLLVAMHFKPKKMRRKDDIVLYLKEAKQIGAFLACLGVRPALTIFENARIFKGIRNVANRLVNCETANLNKTVQTALRQIRCIQQIDQHLGWQQLPSSLREVAELRCQHPELSLGEIGQRLPSGKISKSAVNHRLRRIEKIANQWSGSGENRFI